jgi:hypothetical protein
MSVQQRATDRRGIPNQRCGLPDGWTATTIWIGLSNLISATLSNLDWRKRNYLALNSQQWAWYNVLEENQLHSPCKFKKRGVASFLERSYQYFKRNQLQSVGKFRQNRCINRRPWRTWRPPPCSAIHSALSGILLLHVIKCIYNNSLYANKLN